MREERGKMKEERGEMKDESGERDGVGRVDRLKEKKEVRRPLLEKNNRFRI